MDEIKLTSEFASVIVKPNFSANGPRLELIDLETGVTVFLDPFQLRMLTRLTSSDFEAFLKDSL